MNKLGVNQGKPETCADMEGWWAYLVDSGEMQKIHAYSMIQTKTGRSMNFINFVLTKLFSGTLNASPAMHKW